MATTKAKAGMEPEESGWGAVLGSTTLQRPERKTEGPGNDLPEAPRYLVTTPMKSYTGVTANLPFQNGQAITEDRDLAWILREDFGYSVEALA